jgi:hypothetical protein
MSVDHTHTTGYYGIHELATLLFKKNNNGSELLLGLEEHIRSNKDLFSFCFQLFCSGLVILYGDGEKVLLNELSIDHLETVKTKLKCAHIHIKTVSYDLDTAILLDIVDKDHASKDALVLTTSIAKLNAMERNERLEDYELTLMLHGSVLQLHFEIG